MAADIPEQDRQALSQQGYELQEVIAQCPWPGPIVLSGVCNTDGRPCAIKICRVSTESFPGQFLKEAQMLNEFDHPNIMKLYYFYRAGLRAYFVMEYMDGGTLREKLRPLSPMLDQTTALTMIKHLTEAVNYIHAHNMIHGDLHAGNIMLQTDQDNNTIYKVVDFGSAVQKTNTNCYIDIQSLANHLTRILEKSNFTDHQIKVGLKGIFDWMFVGFYKTTQSVIDAIANVVPL